MNTEPIYVTFEFNGNLGDEVARVKLGIQGLRDESANTYKRLLSDSNEAFNAMSANNRKLAISIQEDINSLRQLNATQKALDDGLEKGTVTTAQYAEATAKLAIQEIDLRNGIQENIKVLQDSIEQERLATGSIESKQQSLAKIEDAYRKLSAAERDSAAGKEMLSKIKELKSELSDLDNSYKKATDSTQSFSEAAQAVPGPVGQTATAIGKMTKAALAFIATPLGMVLAAIAAGLAAVSSWFHRAKEGEDALAIASATFSQVLNSLLDVVDNVGEWLYKAFTSPKHALEDLVDFMNGQVINRFKAVGKAGEAVWKILKGNVKEGLADFANAQVQFATGIEDAGKKAVAWSKDVKEKAKESASLQERLNILFDKENALLVKRSEMEARINELRDKAYDMSIPESKRAEALKEALKLTDDLYAKEKAIAKEKYDIIKTQNSLAHSGKADLRAEAEAEAEINRIEAQRYSARRMMLRQSNTIDKQISKDSAGEAANVIKAETAMRELEIQRAQETLMQKEKDAELELRQQKINLLKDGTDKELAQITLDYDRKINEIEKKGQEYILARQKIEQAQWENANPNWKKKGLVFKPKTTTVSQLPAAQGKELSDATLTADNAREKAEADLLEKTLKQYQDYATKRLEIEKKYNEDIAYLTSQRTDANKAAIDAAIAEAGKAKDKALSNLSFSELKDTDMWSKFFGDLDKMALPSLEALLKQAKEVNTSAWNPKNVKEYQDAIDRLEKAIKTRSPFKSIGEDWKKLLKGIKEGSKDDIASALSGIDTAVQKINGDLNTIVGGIGEVFGDEAGYAAEQVVALTSALGGFATGAAKIASGDILGGIASVVSSIGSIFSMGKKVKEMNRQAREEVQKYYDTAIEGEREYQLLLRERQRTQQEIGESTLAYNKRITSELNKQQRESAEEYARLMAEIQGEEYISGKGYKHGTWFRKAKTWDIYSSLAGKSYEDIEKLYTEGKLDEKVAKLFEQLRALKEEGADINQMLADQDEAMREVFTGTTKDSIADSVIKGLAQGKRSAKDFADDFQEMLNNAVLQGVKMKALEEPLRKWYESFAEASGNGLTEANIADLKAQYDKIIEDAAKRLEDAEKITGLSITGTEAGRQAAAKGEASMSQDSANELNGNFNALLIYADKTSTAVTNINTLLVEGLTVMNRIAANTDRLENIENDIRSMRNSMIDMLNKGLLIRKTA